MIILTRIHRIRTGRLAYPAIMTLVFGLWICCAPATAFQTSAEDAPPFIPNNQTEPLAPPTPLEVEASRLYPPAERLPQPDVLTRQLPQAMSRERSLTTPPAEQGAGLDQIERQNLPSELMVPFRAAPLPERSIITASGDHITLVIRDASLGAVLNALAEEMNLNVVTSGDVNGTISITLNNVPLEDALDAILSVNGYRWVRQRNIIMVSRISKDNVLSPRVQGREVRVFRLSFASASDIDKTVNGLLSPVGTSYITEIDALDKRKTREELVVEDLPEYLDRVQAYIQQADRPPAQVLIEAYVLQVNLRDDHRHGVELENIISLTGGDLTLSANGIADPNASPAFIINLDGRRLDAIVELIKETTDAKTLASPKVLAVNGQEARIQIGERLGYLTTTTTQTSTLQQVNFLDLGVVLTTTPVISGDGHILMTVKPEVSSGSINPTTGLPDSDTTEVESTVLVPSGHAMVIGGLITEEDTDLQAKAPWIGDIPGIGKLFQRRRHLKARTEIIIALLPRIVPYGELAQCRHAAEVKQATSPILYGPLIPTNRTSLEATLPNANRYCDEFGKPIELFPTPPVAYSPHSVSQPHLPYLPPAAESYHSAPPPTEYQPKLDGSTAPQPPMPDPDLQLPSVIQQTSARGDQTKNRLEDGTREKPPNRLFGGWRRRILGR